MRGRLQYRSSAAYQQLLEVVGRFRFYSPFNALLVHIQKPGSSYVAPPHRWLRQFQRRIKPDARPLVILQRMGPVMFVFDVADTEPLPDAPPLPREIANPFEVSSGRIRSELSTTIDNAKRDGVRVGHCDAGAQGAGAIQESTGGTQDVIVRVRPQIEVTKVPVRYEVLLNSKHSAEARYATLVRAGPS